jgi:alpha/beta superfamily hydrolase
MDIGMVINTKLKTFYLLFFLLLAVCSFEACQRLDDNLFNPTRTSRYELDSYSGEQDFILDESYKIDSSNLYQFLLFSRLPNETFETYISAIYIGNIGKISTDTVILYCHGNKGNMDFYWQRAKLLANIGGKNRYGVLMFDYRGFGKSQGKSTEATMYADVDAALRWLQGYGLTGSRLVVYGFSLGSAPATEICYKARTISPSALILEAPFASSYAMVESSSKLNMPASYFTNHQINNAKKIKSVIQPFIWIHGKEDDFLSMTTQGKVVYDNYRGKYSESHIINGANHSNVPNTMGFENYKKAIYNFITKTK